MFIINSQANLRILIVALRLKTFSNCILNLKRWHTRSNKTYLGENKGYVYFVDKEHMDAEERQRGHLMQKS